MFTHENDNNNIRIYDVKMIENDLKEWCVDGEKYFKILDERIDNLCALPVGTYQCLGEKNKLTGIFSE